MGVDISAWRPEAGTAVAAPSRQSAVGSRQSAAGSPGGMRRLARRLTASRGRVKAADVVVMMRHLATLLGAGLQLSKSLRTVARQVSGSPLGAVVSSLAQEVDAGEMLSMAMTRRADVFDSLTINVIRAGEAGGTLEKTLEQLADDMEKKQELRRTVVGAMVYPGIVIGIATVLVGFMLVFVVPVFEDVYTKMKLDLPWITRLLLAASRAVQSYWWALAAAAVGGTFGFRALKKMARFRRHWDRLLLSVPLFGSLRRKAIAARFLSAFATLVGSGVSIVESLRLLARLADNAVVEDAVREMHRHVSRGGRLSQPMERHADLFSPMAVQMIGVGEESGSLPEAAGRTAEFLAKDVEARVKTLTTLMEPALTVALGLVVGAVVMAIYLPMFDLMKHVSK